MKVNIMILSVFILFSSCLFANEISQKEVLDIMNQHVLCAHKDDHWFLKLKEPIWLNTEVGKLKLELMGVRFDNSESKPFYLLMQLMNDHHLLFDYKIIDRDNGKIIYKKSKSYKPGDNSPLPSCMILDKKILDDIYTTKNIELELMLVQNNPRFMTVKGKLDDRDSERLRLLALTMSTLK